MSGSKTTETNSRLNHLFDDLVARLRSYIRENHLTHDEYRQAVAFSARSAAPARHLC